MKRLFATAALAVILGASVGTAYADDFLGSYVARMSWKDHEASDGYKLDTAAQVVRPLFRNCAVDGQRHGC